MSAVSEYTERAGSMRLFRYRHLPEKLYGFSGIITLTFRQFKGAKLQLPEEGRRRHEGTGSSKFRSLKASRFKNRHRQAELPEGGIYRYAP